MTEAREHWDEVARRFESLALKLKLHYEENAAEDRAELDSALRTRRRLATRCPGRSPRSGAMSARR